MPFGNNITSLLASFVIGHVGRLAPEKNLGYLTQAVDRAMQQHANTHFLVVGEGPSQERILRIFNKSGLEERLTFTGSLTGQALADAYHAMNFLPLHPKPKPREWY